MDTPLISKDEIKKKLRVRLTQTDENACFIFGAGASFGYSTAISKPPTVKDLFEDDNPIVQEVINRREHGSIKTNRQHLSTQLRNYDNDLEQYLSFMYERNSADNLFSNLLVYLEDIFFKASEDFVSEPNNYKTLINLMWDLHGNKRWSCISFNYDTLLERSYLEARRDPTGRAFDSLKSYTDPNPTILKIHGGINFRYAHTKPLEYGDDQVKLTNYTLFSKMMSNEGKLANGLLEVIHPESHKPANYDSYYNKASAQISSWGFPLMLIPIHATIKPENIFFKNMIDLAKKEIERSSIIIAIGYNFGDESFISELSRLDLSGKEIILVNTLESIKDISNHLGYQRIKTALPGVNLTIFDGNGFKGFIEAIQ